MVIHALYDPRLCNTILHLQGKAFEKNHMINFNLYDEDKKSTIGIILSFDNETEGPLKSFSL